VALLPSTRNLKRYRELAVLLVRYGRSDLVRQAGLADVVDGEETAPASDIAAELAGDLERLGPTFVKLGQLLSTRADLLLLPVLEGLARLQDRVAPFPFAEAEEIVTGELGVRLSKAFSVFEEEPIAAASLGQVHRAALRDGRPVAVKVQRPGLRPRIVDDMDALGGIASMLDRHTEVGRRLGLEAVVEQLRRGLLSELDYRQEARNLQTLADNLAEFERIVVPRPVEDYSSERVLTSDFIRGEKVTGISPLSRIDTDGAALAEELFRAYLWQILVDGFVHADPHPGNVFLTEDGRIALLDPGMVAHVSPRLQDRLLQLLLAVSDGRSEEAASVALRIGEPTPGFDEARFRRDVGAIVSRTRDASLEHLQVGSVVLQVTRASTDCGVRVPAELALLGKTLLNLDQVGQVLDPDFDPTASLRRNAGALMRARAAREASPGRLYSAALDVKEFVERLPQRANRILETAARNELSLRVDAIEEQVLVDGFQKVANRITVGLILAALIVGAALMMRVETSFRILGYPGIAILCFLAAAAGGVWLILSIVLGDSGSARRR